MTSREIIQAVLAFADPPRIGLQLAQPHTNDILFGWRQSKPPELLPTQGNEAWRRKDEWGVTWASLTEYDKGEVVAGAIEDWAQLADYSPPDLGQTECYAEATSQFAADKERFRLGGLDGMTFKIAQGLRRLDNYLCDLALQPEKIARLHEMVRAELLKNIDAWADAGADGVMFWEDWGTQDRLMISPEMWREVFRPEFEVLVGRARQRGLAVIMHSCGAVDAIIDDLIEVGVSCLQFDQPTLHGIDHLSNRYGGRVAFWCPVDIQRTLQTRDETKIRSEARELVEKLACFGGGFIAGHYSGDAALGLPPETQRIADAAFEEFAALNG